MNTAGYRIAEIYNPEVKSARMNVTIADEDCYAIVIACQDAWRRMEVLKNGRSFQLEVLYTSLKDGEPTDSIMQAIAILDKAEINQRKLYLTLVKAQADTINAWPGNPPLNDAQQIF